MKKELAEEFINNRGLLTQLGELIHDEIINDDEPFDKIAHNLLDTYLEHPDVVDEVMVSICGWTMESLMNKV